MTVINCSWPPLDTVSCQRPSSSRSSLSQQTDSSINVARHNSHRRDIKTWIQKQTELCQKTRCKERTSEMILDKEEKGSKQSYLSVDSFLDSQFIDRSIWFDKHRTESIYRRHRQNTRRWEAQTYTQIDGSSIYIDKLICVEKKWSAASCSTNGVLANCFWSIDWFSEQITPSSWSCCHC